MENLIISTMPYAVGYKIVKSVGIFQSYCDSLDTIRNRLKIRASEHGANGVIDYKVQMDQKGFLATASFVVLVETTEPQPVTPCGRAIDLK